MTHSNQQDETADSQAIIAELLRIAQQEGAQNLLEMSAASLYPQLYEEAVELLGGWDGALAHALVEALQAQDSAQPSRARATTVLAQEEVSRVVNEEAEQPLFVRTQNGAFYTVSASALALCAQPTPLATPHGAGVVSGLDFLGEPNGVVVITQQGRYFGIDVRMVPVWDGESLNRRVQDVIHLDAEERIIATLPRAALYTSSAHTAMQRRAANRLIHITRDAKGKASLVSDMVYTLDRQGRDAFLLNPGDTPITAMVGPQKNSVFCASALGKAIHFDAADIRTMGLKSVGVNVMKLEDQGDAIVGAFLGEGVTQVAVITRRGVGKRVEFDEFRPQSRAGAGLQLLRLDSGDQVAAVIACEAAKDLAVLTSLGRVVRTPATHFPRMGRPAKGNLILDLFDEEYVVGLSALPCGG